MSELYLDRPLSFKARKVLRYLQLLGPTATLKKIQGQLHLNRTDALEPLAKPWVNHRCQSPSDPERYVSLIGAGNFAYTTIAHYCRAENRKFLRSVFDVRGSRAVSLCRAYGGAMAVSSVEQIAQDENVRLVFIASNHASHADYATMMLDAGKDVHIEKPHVVSDRQLLSLSEAMSRNPERSVFLGFNRPKARLFQRIKSAVENESGSLMINWFIAGHEIPRDHWYFSEEEGGRLLGNVCHWTDLSLELVDRSAASPVTVSGLTAGSQSDYVLNFIFGDNSACAITFSAKGHTFEGVREVLNLHRGSTLISLHDFEALRIDQGHKRNSTKLWFRDHGHRSNILNSLRGEVPVPRTHVVATARLFLAAKRSTDTGAPVTISLD